MCLATIPIRNNILNEFNNKYGHIHESYNNNHLGGHWPERRTMGLGQSISGWYFKTASAWPRVGALQWGASRARMTEVVFDEIHERSADADFLSSLD